MNSELIFIIRLNIVFTALYGMYWLILKNLTFFRFNRMVLLAIMLLSVSIPLIPINTSFSSAVSLSIPQFTEYNSETIQQVTNSTGFASSIRPATFFCLIYAFISLIFILKLVLSALKIVNLKRKSISEKRDNYRIITINTSSAFSVFHWIFSPAGETLNNTVLEHEKVHIKHHHSVDLIMCELFIALNWINPLVYFFRKSVKTNHEYQVDAEVLNGKIKKSTYLQELLCQVESQVLAGGISNYFNGITLKTRLKMITKNKTRKHQIVRYILFIPMIAFLSMAFSDGESNIPSVFPLSKESGYFVGQEYGVTSVNPYTNKTVTHKGIDLAAPMGSKIFATADGIVSNVSEEKGYGKLVIIDHGDGIQSLYSHLQEFNVENGDKVKAGDIIGFVGETGYSTAPHLHFEIIINGERVDPMTYLKQ